LVEEMAAAASSLNGQAHELVQLVAVFKLSPDQDRMPPYRAAPNRTAPPAAAPVPVRSKTLMSATVKQIPRR
jgi:methyl-accepting chemotaxis protein